MWMACQSTLYAGQAGTIADLGGDSRFGWGFVFLIEKEYAPTQWSTLVELLHTTNVPMATISPL